MTTPSFTVEYLRGILSYDRDTGVFTWKVTTGTAQIGAVAGSLKHTGYFHIGIDGRAYLAHRLAWFYVHGEWPGDLDHKDTIRTHNWIENLRPSSRSLNGANTRIRDHNTSGFKGVTWHKKAKKWQSSIKVAGRGIYLGLYDDPALAHAAYCAAATEHFGEFSRSK